MIKNTFKTIFLFFYLRLKLKIMIPRLFLSLVLFLSISFSLYAQTEFYHLTEKEKSLDADQSQKINELQVELFDYLKTDEPVQIDITFSEGQKEFLIELPSALKLVEMGYGVNLTRVRKLNSMDNQSKQKVFHLEINREGNLIDKTKYKSE